MIDTKLCPPPPSLQSLTEAWESERAEMKQLQAIKGEMERVNLEIQNAEREYDLNRAAELKYGVLAGLQKQLQKAEDDLRQQVGGCPRFQPPPGVTQY